MPATLVTLAFRFLQLCPPPLHPYRKIDYLSDQIGWWASLPCRCIMHTSYRSCETYKNGSRKTLALRSARPVIRRHLLESSRSSPHPLFYTCSGGFIMFTDWQCLALLRRRPYLLFVALAALVVWPGYRVLYAASVPSGFTDSLVANGLSNPT